MPPGHGVWEQRQCRLRVHGNIDGAPSKRIKSGRDSAARTVRRWRRTCRARRVPVAWPPNRYTYRESQLCTATGRYVARRSAGGGRIPPGEEPPASQ